MEAFFAGVIKESELMLEWAAETGYGNRDASNRPRVFADGHECGQMSAKPGVCAAADAYSAHGLSRVMRRMTIVANSRKNPLEETAEAI